MQTLEFTAMERSRLDGIILSAMPKLRGIANKMVASFRFGEASDLLQDCLLKMLSNADSYDGSRSDVCSVAYVVMNNIQINEYHRRKVLIREDLSECHAHCRDQAAEEAQLGQLLEGCNAEARLRYEGYSVKEISEIAGCSKGTVVNRLNANVPFLMAETGYSGDVDRRRGCRRTGRVNY